MYKEHTDLLLSVTNKMNFFDSHAHYNDTKFDEDREELIQKIYNEGITKLVNAGYSLESSKQALAIAKKYDWMYTISGISPNDIPENANKLDEEIKQLEELICNEKLEKKNERNTNKNIDESSNKYIEKSIQKTYNKIVAIGEIGLDYHWNTDNISLQKKAFVKQIELANNLKLPIVIHTREAVMDTIQILKENEVLKKGVFHCCPLNRELVKEALKLGFYISFAGPVTFKNSKNANEIIEMCPLDKILIETDSPYLSPEPNRGRRNDSRNVKYIAKKIADVKQMKLEEIAIVTCENACKIFGIDF